MNSADEFSQSTADLEQRLASANAQYHKCLGTVIEKFVIKERGFEDVTKHCTDQKKRVDTLMKELDENYYQ
jgi:hypothetical protein